MKTRSVLAVVAMLAALASGAAHATWLRVLVTQPLDGSSMEARAQITTGDVWRSPFDAERPLFGDYQLAFSSTDDVIVTGPPDASPTGITIVLGVSDQNVITTGTYDFYQSLGGAPLDRMTVSQTGLAVTIAFLASTASAPLTPMPGATSLLLGDPDANWSDFEGSILVAQGGSSITGFPLYVGFQRIPEPGTAWLLLGLGFSVFGASLRRRRCAPADVPAELR